MSDNPTSPRGSGQTSPLAMVAGRRDWRLELERRYQPLSLRLQDAYRRLTPGIERAIGALSSEIQGMIERGEDFSPQALRDMTTYQQLLARIQVEMRDFGAVVRQVGAEAQTEMLQLGLDAALDAVTAQVGNAQVLASVWMRPDPAALQNIVNYAESDAFVTRMQAFGDNAARDFADTMLGLTAQGQNPRAIARGMTQWLGIPYTWAENSTRTMQLYSYRLSNHAAFAANPRVLTGWMWRAALDLRTCMSCVRQHGSIHKLDDALNDHHRGRCAPVPIVRGATWPDAVESGEAWFNRQPANVQRRMMGRGMYSAWKRDEFAFSDLSRTYTDDVYGEMLRAATLQELTGLRARAPRGQITTLNGFSDRDTGAPGNSVESLNTFLDQSNGPLVGALLGDIGEPNRLVELGADGRYAINTGNVAEQARNFVQQSLDVQYSREYIVGLAQDIARENGLSVSARQAERLMNQQYGTQADAILTAARIGRVRLTEAQQRRLEISTRGGYLDMVYSREGSERGSLAGQRTGSGLARTAEARAIRAEQRRNFLSNVMGVDDI